MPKHEVSFDPPLSAGTNAAIDAVIVDAERVIVRWHMVDLPTDEHGHADLRASVQTMRAIEPLSAILPDGSRLKRGATIGFTDRLHTVFTPGVRDPIGFLDFGVDGRLVRLPLAA